MKRGSALLIVLGMASFIMVSAIAFSVYMRESRVPSSHLRRQVSSRYLLKAALANAIDRLDGQFASYKIIGRDDLGNEEDIASGLTEGIYDDPYPGVGPSQNDNGADDERDVHFGNRNGDLWIDRVFTPFGQVGDDQTVPTLTLEALAYLPPAVINEVRINSRKTRTAMWRNLSYELGRYAFTAVNVSDCFDLNRLAAGNRRTSAPGERISMSSLFRQKSGGLANLDTSLADKFDAILDKSGDIPFVSLADFNVVAGKSDFSPFCRYIGQSSSEIYTDRDTPALSNALFVTDTWFPPTNRTDTSVTVYNLAAQQPFTSVTSGKTASDVMEMGGSGFYDDLNRVIGTAGMLALYDYLDKDSRPLSFCIPTVETVPMVVGIGLQHADQIKPEAGELEQAKGEWRDPEMDPQTGEPTKKFIRTATLYGLKSLVESGAIRLKGSAMFPFLRTDEKGYGGGSEYKCDVLVRAWWAPWGIRGRLDPASPIYPSPANWKSADGKPHDGIVTVVVKDQQLNLTKPDPGADEEKKGMAEFNVPVDLQDVTQMPMFWQIHDAEVDKDGKEIKSEDYCVMDGLIGNEALFRPYEFNNDNYCREPPGWWQTTFHAGSTEPPVKDGQIVKKEIPAGPGRVDGKGLNGEKFTFHLAAWVQVKRGGDVVDMAPARFSDDKDFGVGEMPDDLGTVFENTFGGDSPVLEFRGDKSLEFSLSVDGISVLNGQADAFNSVNAMYCNDPRYNWAPECWFMKQLGDGDMIKGWRDEVGNALLGKSSGGYVRDRDIFMFTSDQEYLQSIGELQFLPYLGWGSGGSFQTFRAELEGEFDGLAVYDHQSAGLGPAKNLYWKTYSAMDDDLYGILGFTSKGASRKFQVISGSGDFRVNPFSDDTRILMTALANTPYDYYVASTNENANKFANEDLDKSLGHAFNEKTDIAYISDNEMNAIARAMHERFRSQAIAGSRNWEDAYDGLGWFGTDPKSFLGVTLEDPLYGVDRKFLYSYWRECFQNRQQLFLLFLRAEPLTVGGSSGDAIANSQLGARGVALVWRDPAPPAVGRADRNAMADVSSWRTGNANGPRPHKTRVLFYHQFD